MALVELDPTDANTIYVGVRGKQPPASYWNPAKGALYKSTDGGATWSNDLLPHNTDNDWKKSAIYSLAIDPTNHQIVYIGQDAYNNQPQQIMKSTDGGQSWSSVCTAGCAGGGPARIKLSPLYPSILWVIMGVNQGHAICYSTDAAGTWTCKDKPLEQFMWSGFFGIAPSLLDPLKATASGSEAWFHKVGQTVDGNVTWAILNSNYGPNDIARDPVWEDRLFAAYNNGDTNHGGVIVSYDGELSRSEYAPGCISNIAVLSKEEE